MIVSKKGHRAEDAASYCVTRDRQEVITFFTPLRMSPPPPTHTHTHGRRGSATALYVKKIIVYGYKGKKL